MVAHRGPAGLQVVADADRHEGHDLEIPRRLAVAGPGEAVCNRLREDVALRVHEDRDHAVGHLRGGAHAGRRDGGGVDREVRVGMQDGLERFAEAGRARPVIGDVVMLAVMLQHALALHDLADDRDIFPGARQRLAERHAVPALDHLRARRADAEHEAPA